MSEFHRTSRWVKFTAKMRPLIKSQLPLPCVDCGAPVYPEQLFDVGHRKAYVLDPYATPHT